MVQIPTSRDVAYTGTRSGRISPSGPSVSVGAAVANAGQNIVQAAYDLNDLRTQENSDLQAKAGFDLETKITQFRDAEEQAFNKAKEDSSESGIGFTRQFIEGYQGRVNNLIKENFGGLTEAQNAQARQTLLGLGNSLYGKSYAYEQQAKTNFYDRTTNSGLDTIRTQIRNNAAPYEELKKQGLAAIDSANMPEPWKAERRALWDADAAESKWRWKFEQDPKTAVREMRGIKVDTTGLANAIKQTSEQLGISPNDLATVMSYETGGTFDPWKKGPTTQWGTHRGLIQWGEPQARKYGVTEDSTIEQQVAAAGQYLKDAGVTPGMGLLDIYSAVNAGRVGRYNASDANNGGAPGTVRDKVEKQMESHKAKAASLLGGTFEAPSADPDLDAIPYDRREQLAAWAEGQYSQQRTQERAAARDNYSLLIATQPDQVSPEVILRDNTLDNGDKAALINSLRTARKEGDGVNQFIAALGAGEVSVNPYDSDQRKVANKAYEKMMGSVEPDQQATVTSGFVASTGYIPEKVQADLRRGSASTDPSQLAQAMEAATVLQKNAPISFSAFDGSAAVAKNLDLYKSYTQSMGYTPDEAAKKIIAASDPEQIRRRDAIIKSEPVKKLLKDLSSSNVAAIFDKGVFSAAPDVGAGVSTEQIQVGVNPEAEAAIVSDYRNVFEEALVDANGDQGAAEEIAKRRFQTMYGTTEFSPLSSNIVVRYPPEKAYPAMAEGGHDYIREQLAEAMKAEGIEADALYLQGDNMTEQDIKSGKPARYQVFYEQDGKIQRYNLPFYADVDAAKASTKAKQTEAIKAAEERMLQNRTEEGRRFPEGRGTGRQERFGNNELYRGIARDNSPMGRAIERSRKEQDQINERVRKSNAQDKAQQDEWNALSPEEQRSRSLDNFLDGPFQKRGNR
jgi:hypothetical protein